METIYVGGYVGYKVATIEDVVNAKNANLEIIDKNGGNFAYYNEDEDRDPTNKEIIERIQDALKSQSGVYAAFYLDCGKVVPQKATTLQSEYHVGDEVYYMRDNKMQKGHIETIQLAKSYYKAGGEYVCSTRNRVKLRNGEVREENEIAESPIKLGNKLVENAEERGI